jgi:D-alanyl-D-alanine carboxypeptidase/D-alanyl-D-alanine-endopeptidase (penicillin-binding protein 4)
MLKDSINLYAEAAMRLNVAPGVFPDNDAALEAVRKRLESWGVVPGEQQLVDGSGLSRRDVITADALLVVLRRLHAAGSSPLIDALPIAGVDGSLASRMRATIAEGNVRAKTGTMSNIRSLAGYVTAADGERLAFVVMVNNFEGAGAAAVQAIDAIAVKLAGFRR